MTEIDDRIVEMRFDNKQFESGVKQTLGTLDRLKAALNLSDSVKSFNTLDAAANNLRLDGIAAGVEALQKRFSTFGIVGMKIIGNLTDSVMGLATKGFRFLNDSIVSGGIKRAMNIENAHFQLQALLKDEAKVQAVMDNAMESVDGTAYAFDEAAKAASQFAASGMKAGDEMMEALMGVVGVAAMTNSQYEDIARIFTTVAGNGRLMGDQLLQFSARGLNAAATLADYFNAVNDGSIEASENVTASIKSLTKGAKVAEGDIRELVSKGQISFDIFAASMNNAFGDSAKKANETFTGAFSNMRAALSRIGAEFISPLVAQNSELVLLFNTMKDRINDVKKALTFDEQLGNVNALTKVVTDSILGMARTARRFLEDLDMEKPMEAFYNAVESVKNIAKGLWSVLSPIGHAIKDVFLSFSMDEVVNMTKRISEITSKLKLNARQWKNVYSVVKGVSSVIKLFIDSIFGIVKAIVPAGKPIASFANMLLEMVGALGRGLSAFTEWIRGSKLIKGAYDVIATGINSAMASLSAFIKFVTYLPKTFMELEGVQRVVKIIKDEFENLKAVVKPIIDSIIDGINSFSNEIKGMIPTNTLTVMHYINQAMIDLAKYLEEVDLTWITKDFEKFAKALKSVFGVATESSGLSTFISGFKTFIEVIKNMFNFNNVIDNILWFRDVVGSFIVWFRDTVGPAFEGFSFGGAVAGAGGIGMIYALVKASKALESASNSLKSIPNLLGKIGSTLTAYQKNLQADSLKKIAGAILILAGALVLLSFADQEKILQASISLSLVAGVLLLGTTKLLEVAKKAKPVTNALTIFSKAMNQLGKSIKWKAIGSALKDFGKTILIIAASIGVLAILYKRDPESIEAAAGMVAIITATMVVIIGLMSLLGQKLDKGMTSFAKAAAGVAALSFALSVTIGALIKLLKIDLPADYEVKLKILRDIFLYVGALTIAVGAANSIGGNGKIAFGSLIGMAALLYVSVSALKKLLEINIPEDYGVKMLIFEGLFITLAALMIAMGAAAKLAGGAIRAAGTILALSAFIVVVVGALLILAVMPIEKMLAGATSLGILLLSLGAALYGAGKITKPEAYKSILGMAITVAAITVSLGVLSMIPWKKLLTAGAALGSMLLSLAVDFRAIATIVKEKVWMTVASMAGVIVTIAVSLYQVAKQPWQQLLSAGVAMGTVLLAFAQTMKIVSHASGIKLQKIELFLLATLSLAPIGLALYELAKQPWQGMLASGAALGVTVLAFAETMKIISATRGLNPKKIAEFLAGTLMFLPIGLALYEVAKHPWQQILAAGVALSAVLLAYTLAFAVIGMTTTNPAAMLTFLAGAIMIGTIGLALYEVAKHPWQQILAAGASISAVLLSMAAAMAICALVGMAAVPALVGIALLHVFIGSFAALLLTMGALFQNDTIKSLLSGGASMLAEIGNAIGEFVGNIAGGFASGVSDSFPKIGENLSGFIEAAKPFFDNIKTIDESTTRGVLNLVKAVGLLTATSLVDGIISFIGGGNSSSIVEFGKELEEFGPHFAAYARSIESIRPEAVEASGNAAMALAKMASVLPNSGGLAAKILGDNPLSVFGEELASFGPHLADYANSVKNVDPDVVEASSSAAQVLADMASTLPNSGGLAAKILGDNRLSTFGAELALFGPFLAAYALSIKDVKPETVTASASAASALSELANALPNSGGFVSLFTGDNGIAAFGTALVSFGQSFSDYYTKVSNVNTEQLGGVTTEFANLVEMARNVKTVDSMGMVGFIEALRDAGETGVTEFIAAFQNSTQNVSNAVSQMIDAATSTVESKKSELESAGSDTIVAYQNGVSNAIEPSFSEVQASMVAIGENVTEGLNIGLLKNMSAITDTAQTIANNIDIAIRRRLGIRSPSKVAEERGKQVDQGLEKGLSENVGIVVEAARDVAEKIDNTLGEGIIGEAASMTIESNYEHLLGVIAKGEKEYDRLMAEQAVKEEKNSSKKEKQNEENLEAEEQYWKALLSIKKNGAEASKYESMSVKEFEAEVLKETTDTLKNYADQLTSTRDQIMSQTDLFSEVKKQEALSKEEITKNLKDQIKQYKEYSEVLDVLTTRLGDSNLSDYIREMGVDSLEQLKVMNLMTDEELSQYANLYDEKMRYATDAATTQLESLREETEAKLQSIFGSIGDTINLYDFTSVFDGSMESLSNYVTNFLTPLEEMPVKAKESAKGVGGGIASGVSEGMFEAQGDMTEAIEEAVEESIMDALGDKSKSAIDFSADVGKWISEGIGAGMLDSVVPSEAGEKVIKDVFETMRSIAEIASPSGLMKDEVGIYLTEGVAEGMEEGMPSIVAAVGNIIAGVVSNFTTDESYEAVAEAMIMVVDNLLMTIEEQDPEFLERGKTSTDSFLQGIKDKYPDSKSVGLTLANNALAGIQQCMPSFYKAGESAGDGLVRGIRSKLKEAEGAGREIAEAAFRAAMRALDAHSPSKKFLALGGYAGIGFVNGLMSYVAEAAKSGEEIANAAIDGTTETMDGFSKIMTDEIGMNMDPVIRPIVDLSNVEKSISEITQLFNDSIAITAASASYAAGTMNVRQNERSNDTQKEEGSEKNTFIFNQTNNSPKHLSRIEIYRQTKNQFAQFKEAVDSL